MGAPSSNSNLLHGRPLATSVLSSRDPVARPAPAPKHPRLQEIRFIETEARHGASTARLGISDFSWTAASVLPRLVPPAG